MKPITPAQLSFAKKLLQPYGGGAAEFIRTASSERTDRLEELSVAEANTLIRCVRADWNPGSAEVGDMKDVKRKKLISYCHVLQWYVEGQPGVVDTDRLDNWCKQYGLFHKPLQEHTLRELNDLLSQFEMMFKKELRKR